MLYLNQSVKNYVYITVTRSHRHIHHKCVHVITGTGRKKL